MLFIGQLVTSQLNRRLGPALETASFSTISCQVPSDKQGLIFPNDNIDPIMIHLTS